jgi:hypothetical protein
MDIRNTLNKEVDAVTKVDERVDSPTTAAHSPHTNVGTNE